MCVPKAKEKRTEIAQNCVNCGSGRGRIQRSTFPHPHPHPLPIPFPFPHPWNIPFRAFKYRAAAALRFIVSQIAVA